MNSIVMDTAIARAGYDVDNKNSFVCPRVAAKPPLALMKQVIPEIFAYMDKAVAAKKKLPRQRSPEE
jgi:hypothetical protein